mmetsp:Transcript_8220/g.34886  ORF Transcript_8220/g.34886 Transcript_8220/m.34886 type:complete len:300 (-) Transcript_8220:15-914(-)
MDFEARRRDPKRGSAAFVSPSFVFSTNPIEAFAVSSSSTSSTFEEFAATSPPRVASAAATPGGAGASSMTEHPIPNDDDVITRVVLSSFDFDVSRSTHDAAPSFIIFALAPASKDAMEGVRAAAAVAKDESAADCFKSSRVASRVRRHVRATVSTSLRLERRLGPTRRAASSRERSRLERCSRLSFDVSFSFASVTSARREEERKSFVSSAFFFFASFASFARAVFSFSSSSSTDRIHAQNVSASATVCKAASFVTSTARIAAVHRPRASLSFAKRISVAVMARRGEAPRLSVADVCAS